MSQETGKPKEKERDEGTAGHRTVRTHINICQLSSPSYIGTVHGTAKTTKIVTSKVTDNRSP